MTVVEEARRATATRISIPYKGLRFFTEDDTEIFFGRETERRLIGMTLRATRFSVVYGESGVGKSSLLRAGVVHDLREKTMADLQERRADGSLRSPPFVPLVFSNWRDDPLPELDACIAKAAEALALSFEAPSGKATTLDRLLEAWCAALDTTLVLVFDQFEEYLMYHPAAGSESFDAGLARVVTNRDVRVRIALSIREDALAKLDRYEKRIPGLFDNSIRVEHLDRAAGRAAIRGPVDRFNAGLSEKEQPVKLQDQLVEDVLTQVEANEIVTDHAGRGVVPSDGRRQPIEAPFLQLVMERLWMEESKSSRTLRASTLKRLGGASKIVLTHLDQALADMDEDDQAVAAAVFRDLVTPSRQKIAHTPSDLAKLEEGQVDGLDETRVRDVLESLAKRRIVRPVAPAPDSTEQRYEIFHDKLADPVLDWRTRHVQAAHAKDADRRARRARLRAQLYAGAALIMLAVAAGCLFLWQQAIEAKKSAGAQELVAASASELPVDPARSVVLAARAIAKKDSPSAQAALRVALGSSPLRFLIRHKGDVYSAKYNDGGTRILTMSSDRTARVSDAATGRTIRTFGYGKNFSDADVSRDGKRVVTAGWDDTVRVWDVDSGVTRARWKNPNVSTVRFDHTGSRVVSSTYKGELVRVFTIGRKSPQVFKVGPGRRAALWGADFDRTGTRIVSWGENTVPRIVDLRTRQVMRLDTSKGHTNWVQAAAFSPDGRLVLTGGVDKRAIVWDAQTGEPLRQVREQSGILAVAFSPNGKRFATTSAKRAHVWQTKTGARLAELRGHTDFVYGVSFRPKNGDLLATASSDGTARVWDIASESTLAALLGNENNLNTAVFSPDGRNVLTSSDDGTAKVWAVDSGLELRGHGGWVLDAQFNTKGDRILTAGEDHRVVLWDALSGKWLGRLRNAGKREVNSVRFSADGKLFVLASNDDTAQIRDGENGELIATIKDNADDVRAADFSPDGKLVVTGAGNGWVGIFNSRDAASVRWLEDKTSLSGNAHDSAVSGVDWSPDGRYIVTTGSDDVARVWNPKTGRPIGRFRNHRGDVYSPSFSRDSRFVVTGGNDRTARVWNVATQKEVSRLDGPAPVRATAFSPTRPWVATGGPEGVVRVWNWRTGQLLAVLRNHADYVNAVSFSPDGKLLLSASDDRTAKLYGCETCESIRPLQPLIDRYERYFGEGR